jgi:hypothetical protein
MLNSHFWNSAVVDAGNVDFYNRYSTAFAEMRSCASSSSSGSQCSGFPASGTASPITGTATDVYVFPRSAVDNGSPSDEAVNDPLWHQIRTVPCTSLQPSAIDVAMGSWSDTNRGAALADALAQQAKSGCVVRIITPYGKSAQAVANAAKGTTVQVRCTNDVSDDGTDDSVTGPPPAPYDSLPSVHSKYMLVSEPSGVGDVFIGSEDFTNNALVDNDEMWDEFDGTSGASTLHDAFEQNFNKIFAESLPCPLPAGV